MTAGCKYSPHFLTAGCKYSPHPKLRTVQKQNLAWPSFLRRYPGGSAAAFSPDSARVKSNGQSSSAYSNARSI